MTDFKIPFNNFKPFINKYVCDKWQTSWNETPFNKLKEIERPYCIGCDTPFTVRHFLLDCADFNRERRSLIQLNNLKDLFKDVSVENILSFLKNINLFNKI